MHIECPHCKNALEIVPEDSVTQPGTCPSCGSRLPEVDGSTTYRGELKNSLGRFELLEVVGRGQFGTVWKARDTRVERIVALKLPRQEHIDDTTKAMFLREARASAAVEHPNIVTVLDVGEIDAQIFIASQFIEGRTLRDKLQAGPMQFRSAARLLATICDAIHKAHEAGVIHRDLKASNILIDHSDKPYVTDFGLAKRKVGEITMTAAGVILGTPAYMSPEQARGDSYAADRRSDVYSLGVILYQLMTGKKPFEGASSLLLHQIQSQEPRQPSRLRRDVPRDLETICLKAMEKSPDKRYQTAAEMAADLERFLNDQPVHARRASFAERMWRRVRRNRTVSAAVAVALLSVGLLIFNLVTGTSSADSIRPEEPQPSLIPISFPANGPQDFYKPADKDGPIAIKSLAWACCFKTHEAPGPSFRVEQRAKLHMPDSDAGVALGLVKINDRPLEYQTLTFTVGTIVPLEGTWLTISEARIAAGGGWISPIFNGGRTLSQLQISKESQELVDLQIEVRNRRVTAVTANGYVLPPSDLEKIPRVAESGAIGIRASGHVTIDHHEVVEE